MKQQPILTSDEVIKMLEEALSKKEGNEIWLNALGELAEKTLVCRFSTFLSKTAIALLKHSATYLRSQGIFVYLKITNPRNISYQFLLIAGECGRVYERLKKQADYLRDLSYFIDEHEHELPKRLVAKQKKIDDYRSSIEAALLWRLEGLYRAGDKEALKSVCEEAWKFAKEIDDYLERNIDLCRVYAVMTAL
jgi:hypothetical protein